ncbi:Fc.00g084000.m01.CDS01 [Cosmosporella sp. VM-42]
MGLGPRKIDIAAWKFFFRTLWNQFDRDFAIILENLAHHREMIHKEAQTIDIVAAKTWSDEWMVKLAEKTQYRREQRIFRIINWLSVNGRSQADAAHQLQEVFQSNESDVRIYEHERVKEWLQDDNKAPAIWLHGKPGAGKSVICSALLDFLDKHDITTLFYFRNYFGVSDASAILRTFILQLIEKDEDLAAVVYSEYVVRLPVSSLQSLRAILGTSEKPGILHRMPTCRIVVDGLDECEDREQDIIVHDLHTLISKGGSSTKCKLLVSSRDTGEISRDLRNQRQSTGVVEVPLSDVRALIGPFT